MHFNTQVVHFEVALCGCKGRCRSSIGWKRSNTSIVPSQNLRVRALLTCLYTDCLAVVDVIPAAHFHIFRGFTNADDSLLVRELLEKHQKENYPRSTKRSNPPPYTHTHTHTNTRPVTHCVPASYSHTNCETLLRWLVFYSTQDDL